jgi:D-alanyl-D-alanine carboxypeptidase
MTSGLAADAHVLWHQVRHLLHSPAVGPRHRQSPSGTIRRDVRVAALCAAMVAVAACGGAIAPTPSPTATDVPTSAALQEALDTARINDGAPGAVAVVRVDGTRIVLASGTADTAGTAITETTRFRIASITKPIVAALVLDAVARGEVGLDDVVGTILPGVLRPAPPVTVRQLLSHTSGIFDESNGVSTQAEIEADIAKLTDPGLRTEATETLQQVLAGKPVIAPDRVIVALSETHERYFAPGAGYHYSNTNFQLAAMVLEQVTGQSLADLLRARIVEPLGLAHTTITPPDLATPEMHGYTVSSDGSLVDVTGDLGWFGNGGNGGIISTADELLTMLTAIVSGDLLTPELRGEMLTSVRSSYGLGIGESRFACFRGWGHQGAVNGQLSLGYVSSDGSKGVVIAMNLRKDVDPDLYALAGDLVCAAK